MSEIHDGKKVRAASERKMVRHVLFISLALAIAVLAAILLYFV